MQISRTYWWNVIVYLIQILFVDQDMKNLFVNTGIYFRVYFDIRLNKYVPILKYFLNHYFQFHAY
jgi:hypothetical protein